MKKRGIRFLVFLMAAILVVVGLSKVRFDVDMLRLLPPGLQQVEGLSYFLKYFARPAELIVTVEADDADAAEEAVDSLEQLFKSSPDLIGTATVRPPWESADMTDFLAFLFLNVETEKIRAAIGRISPERAAETLEESRERIADSGSPFEVMQLTRDPFRFSEALTGSFANPMGSTNEFSSEDGSFRALYITAPHPFKDYRETIQWVRSIGDLLGEWKGSRNIRVGLTGEPAFVAEISSTMQWEMMSSGVGSLILIGLIFWGFQRRILPVVVLMGILVLVYFLTLAVAGFVLPELTVIGAGFASIMVGLGVDYGYLLYQDWRDHKGDVRGARRRQAFAIWSASLTTAAAFFSLNFSSLPGLSQLGNLVGIGVLIAAACMQSLYVMFLSRSTPPDNTPPVFSRLLTSEKGFRVGTLISALLFILLVATVFIKGLPPMDISMRAFRSQHGQAQAALDRLNERLLDGRELLSLIVTGKDETEVFHRLQAAEAQLEDWKAEGKIADLFVPTSLWPEPGRQEANLALLAPLADEKARLLNTLDAGGFTEDAFSVAGPILDTWKSWEEREVPIWPEDEAGEWILRRIAHHEDGFAAAMGVVTPVEGREAEWTSMSEEGVYLVSWERLASELKDIIPKEIFLLLVILISVVILLLSLIFRNVREVGIIILTLVSLFTALNGGMVLLGIEWNFFNLAAVLLLLGTGVDYSIYMVLALRRNPGALRDAQASMAKVIFLCASSAAVGFGSISWFSNYGLASLGRTCALGLVLDALIVVYLLPLVWKALCARPASHADG